MSNDLILELLKWIGTGGVAALGSYSTYRLGLKKARTNHADVFLARVIEDNKRLTVRIEKLESEQDRLEAELTDTKIKEAESRKELQWLQQQMSIMEAADSESPFPHIFIDINNKIQSFNDSFRALFITGNSLTVPDFVGVHVDKVQPEVLGKDLANNILRIEYKYGDHKISENAIEVFDDRISRKWRLCYWPKFIGEKHQVGMNVQAFPEIEPVIN